MSVEQRLRDGLARNAEAFHPDVEGRLGAVRRGQRHRSRVQWALAGVAVLAFLAAAAALAPALLASRHRGDLRIDSTTAAGQVLTGSYSTTVAAAAGVVTDRNLSGTWTVTWNNDGRMGVQAPTGYTGVLSGALFQSTPGAVRTDVFGQDLCSGLQIGRYRWTRTGNALMFTLADDRCEGRVAVLTSAPWTRTR